MIKIQNVLKYLFSRNGISDAANVFTIGAFGIAFYAIFNPGTVSSYLNDISEEAEKTNVILASVDDSAASISDSTSDLAAEIPYWLEVSELNYGPPSGGYLGSFSITIQNNSNYAFTDVGVKIFQEDGELAHNREGTVIPPREEFTVSVRSVKDALGVVCIWGYGERSGLRFFDSRNLGYDDASREAFFSSWDLSNDRAAGVCR